MGILFKDVHQLLYRLSCREESPESKGRKAVVGLYLKT
jgi:hypothetical protein